LHGAEAGLPVTTVEPSLQAVEEVRTVEETVVVRWIRIMGDDQGIGLLFAGAGCDGWLCVMEVDGDGEVCPGDLATMMLTVSDNAATDLLIDRVGLDRVAGTLAELALEGTRNGCVPPARCAPSTASARPPLRGRGLHPGPPSPRRRQRDQHR
jgi:hypothetical protein